jgi:hypothetical protein
MHRSHENKGQHDAEKEKANTEVQYNEVHGSISSAPAPVSNTSLTVLALSQINWL